MSIQEKFIAWMKDQGAWDEYVKSCEIDDWTPEYVINNFNPECFISSSFAWFEAKSGSQYWVCINKKWLKYLENNK